MAWIGYIFSKNNKMGKEGNVCVKIKHISLLKKSYLKKIIFSY